MSPEGGRYIVIGASNKDVTIPARPIRLRLKEQTVHYATCCCTEQFLTSLARRTFSIFHRARAGLGERDERVIRDRMIGDPGPGDAPGEIGGGAVTSDEER